MTEDDLDRTLAPLMLRGLIRIKRELPFGDVEYGVTERGVFEVAARKWKRL